MAENKIYPNLEPEAPEAPEAIDKPLRPTAPPLKPDPSGQFRLAECTKIRDTISNDLQKYQKLMKKNKIAYNITNWSSIGTTLTSSTVGIASLSLLALSSGATFGIPLVGAGIVGSVLVLIANVANKKLVSKIKKYDKIITLAMTYSKSIRETISNALMDETISHMEYRMVRNEYEKYISAKQEIKKKHFAYDAHNIDMGADLNALKKQIMALKQNK